MKVSITISDLDVKKIIFIGLKPWTQITPGERSEYERLISLYGTAALMAVIKSA